MSRTLYDKIWDSHLVGTRRDGSDVIYIDRHLLHEVTSPQAFEGLASASRSLWRKGANLATPDHAIPTRQREQGVDAIQDLIAKEQVETLQKNCASFDVQLFDIKDERQGIVHVVGPEQGFTLPGSTIVCGDSHTSTHGAFGALAHGIGTSEVEHVLATQCLVQRKAQNMRVVIDQELHPGVSAKDIVLALIRQIGIDGATGFTIEYMGKAIREMSVEGRMTVCNMSIEAGAKAGLVAPDDMTFAYIEGRPYSPIASTWNRALDYWRTLPSDLDSEPDETIHLAFDGQSPQVTWGTNPEMAIAVDETVPTPESFDNEYKQESVYRALEYMNLVPGTSLREVAIDKVFIGSCTNSRIEDLRAAAEIVRNRRVSRDVALALVVPGSGLVKKQAEAEGLDQIFTDAGFEWRAPGCSMCLGMNDDILSPGERCVSTSNRNFEGRQGHLGRTHLASPQTAAASAIAGTVADVRDYL